jgi:phage terminase large subunit-like protein
VWFDEEPPMEIYSEGRTRTNKGQLGVFNIITFTPLLGMSEVVRLFLADSEVEQMTK